MESASDAFTSGVELLGNAVDSVLRINRELVSAFFGSLWYFAVGLAWLCQSILCGLLTICDQIGALASLFYWCAERILIGLSKAVLRVDFISQTLPEKVVALTSRALLLLADLGSYLRCLILNVASCIVFPIKLIFSTLEYFGREIRETATETFEVAVAALWGLGDLAWRLVAWMRTNLSPGNLKRLLCEMPFVWSFDFYLSIGAVCVFIFICRRFLQFMRERNLTCWPLQCTAQLKMAGHFLRRKLKWPGRIAEEREREGRERSDAVVSLCRRDSERTELCIVCMERVRGTLLLPCRHLCLCSVCWELLDANFGDNRICPLCRSPVSAFVSDVFL